jgi:NADPH2:quinone reductase
MRAAVLTEYGRTPEVTDFDEPRAADDQVVVDVRAAGLNPIDLRLASGTLPARRPPLPCVVGSEGVGTTPDGRRVYFGTTVWPWGSLAERTVVSGDELVEVPDGVDDPVAVACGIAGLAGWGALERGAQLQAGETVIVLGASGAVGRIAVQAAKLLGAGRVVAAARHTDGLDRFADAVVALDRDGEALTEALREACEGDADVVFDPLWGAPAAAALGALGFRGRLVQLGESAGATASLASAAIRFKEIAILGYTNFASTFEERAGAHQRLFEHAAAGELHVDVDVVALADAAQAWERQAAGPGAKLVVVP